MVFFLLDRTNLEGVGRFNFSSHQVKLLVVHFLDFSESIAHFIFPEVSVFSGGVPVGKGSQLLQLLKMEMEIKIRKSM